ncbi:hypothetical protein Vpro01_02584 [Vibrio proteolyticus]
MNTPKTNANATLCCPLCESEEFLISENSHNMLCAHCGSFLQNINQIHRTVSNSGVTSASTNYIHNTNCTSH